MSDPTQIPSQPSAPDENQTGLPLLRAWWAVYLFVTAVFIAYAVVLTILTRMYR